MTYGVVRKMMFTFGILMVLGWALVAILAAREIAISAPDAAIAGVAGNFAQARVVVESDAQRYERAEQYAMGPALQTLQAEAAAKPAPQPDLSYKSGQFILVFRSGDAAFVEANYTVTKAGKDVQIGELDLLRFDGSEWLVSQVYRLQLPPSGPLVAPAPTVVPSSLSAAP